MRAKKTTAILLALALLHAIPHLSAFDAGGQESVGQPREVEITGRVRLVGTSRFPSLMIAGEERDWLVADDERDKLMDLQQRVVTVRAQEHTYEVVLANGLVSRRHHVLRGITVVRVGG